MYLIVDDYRCANSGRLKAAWNWLLPPNVFYTEVTQDNRVLRCKYAVLSGADLEKGTSRRWFHSYLWGRFSQPTAIAWCRDEATRARVQSALAQATLSFLARVLPAVPARGTLQSLWESGLRLSYRAELRAEGSARARQLTDTNLPYFQAVSRAAAPLRSNVSVCQRSSAGTSVPPSSLGALVGLGSPVATVESSKPRPRMITPTSTAKAASASSGRARLAICRRRTLARLTRRLPPGR